MVLGHNKFDKFCFWDKTFRSMSAVPKKVSFCSSLMVIVPGIFPLCFSSPFLMSPRAPITTDIISVFIPPILIVSIPSLGLYLESFSVIFDEGFLWDGNAISMSLQVLFICSLIIISGLLVCYFSICVYLHSPNYRSFFIFSDRRWFMFIAHLQHLDVVVLTRFPIDLIGVISGFNT